jgi:hypothetical protein
MLVHLTAFNRLQTVRTVESLIKLYGLQEFQVNFTDRSTVVVPNLWYAYSWGYAADRLGVRENNIGNGGKHQKKKELK